MLCKSGNDFFGRFVVVTELTAAVRMRESKNPLHRAFHKLPVIGGKLLCNAVDAADGRQNPYLVSYSDLAVLAAVALKKRRLTVGQFFKIRLVFELFFLLKSSSDVVRMHPFTRLNIGDRCSDHTAVFDDILARLNFSQGYLVSERDVLLRRDGKFLRAFALFDIFQCHKHIVRGVDLNYIHSRHSFIAFRMPELSIFFSSLTAASSKPGSADSSLPKKSVSFRIS